MRFGRFAIGRGGLRRDGRVTHATMGSRIERDGSTRAEDLWSQEELAVLLPKEPPHGRLST
jgi:hypothetical protein